MRTVLMNYVHPDDATAYYALSPQEQAADVDRHIAWFRRHADHIAGGEELDEPAKVKTLRPGRQGEGVVVTDGPYVEAEAPRRIRHPGDGDARWRSRCLRLAVAEFAGAGHRPAAPCVRAG